MNNKIILCALTLLGTTLLYGQRGQGREKIKALKVAHITEQLDLTSKEAEVFWPAYNAHDSQMEELRRKERREISGKLRNLDELSDTETKALLNELMALQREKHQVEFDFMQKMQKIISPKKTLLLVKAEEDFKRRLLHEMRKRRSGDR
ncbi:MAG: hypothetical protein AAGA86_02255 [Bacteroidota bacterium]